MAIRFRGHHEQRLDDKCRLSIPASYRQALQAHGDPRLMLVPSLTQKCLVVYPAKAWEDREEKILLLPQSDPIVEWVMQSQVSYAQPLEPDSHGRVVLPPPLRAKAGIGPNVEVDIAGQIDRFEIWAKDSWAEVQARCEQVRPDFAAQLARLGL